MAKFGDYLKNIFFILLLLQFAPPLLKGIKKQYSDIFEFKSKVGFLNIKGTITDAPYYVKYLKKYFERSDIKAILLRIESPGGASGSAESIAHEIDLLKKEYPKPLVCYTENICASGGYYIASSTDYIIAPETALVAGIGTVIPFQFKVKDFLENYKIGYNEIAAGEYKLATNPFVNSTPEQNKWLQTIVDTSYQSFTEYVANHRPKLSLDTSNDWANGKIFTGRQALKIGLIDGIGSRSDAIKKIKELAVIEDKIEWVKPEPKHGFLSFFTGPDQIDPDEPMITNLVNRICTVLETRYSKI